jgi:hypothetical protein
LGLISRFFKVIIYFYEIIDKNDFKLILNNFNSMKKYIRYKIDSFLALKDFKKVRPEEFHKTAYIIVILLLDYRVYSDQKYF